MTKLEIIAQLLDLIPETPAFIHCTEGDYYLRGNLESRNRVQIPKSQLPTVFERSFWLGIVDPNGKGQSSPHYYSSQHGGDHVTWFYINAS